MAFPNKTLHFIFFLFFHLSSPAKLPPINRNASKPRRCTTISLTHSLIHSRRILRTTDNLSNSTVPSHPPKYVQFSNYHHFHWPRPLFTLLHSGEPLFLHTVFHIDTRTNETAATFPADPLAKSCLFHLPDYPSVKSVQLSVYLSAPGLAPLSSSSLL